MAWHEALNPPKPIETHRMHPYDMYCLDCGLSDVRILCEEVRCLGLAQQEKPTT